MAEQTTPNYQEYGFTRDGKVFLKAYREFPDRQIGEVKNTEDEALKYFANRFQHIASKVDKLIEDIEEATNKGSYLMKLIHMRLQLETYDGLGDFIPLYKRLDDAEAYIQDLIDVNRSKNTEIKSALLAELQESLTDITDWPTVNAKIKEIREKWLKTGSVFSEQEQELEGTYFGVLNAYYDQRKAYFEQRQILIDQRVIGYQAVVDKIAGMTGRDINAVWAAKQIPLLKDEWKLVGPIPKLNFEPLIQAFKGHVKTIQRNLKNQRGEKKPSLYDQALMDNMKAKKVIINQVYDLANEDLRIAFGKTKELQEKWKGIGNVPDYKKNELNAEFNYACDRIFEMSYLMRNVYVRYRFFNTKSQIEQFSIKIQLLKEIIKRDEEELQVLKQIYEAHPEKADKKHPEVRTAYNKVQTQERKLRVKYVLTSEMQQAIDKL
jgi:hypothetical protein